MTTTSSKRHSLTLFQSHDPQGKKGTGRITVEWSGPAYDGLIPEDRVDTVHITSASGNRTTYEFTPGDGRIGMLIEGCNVAWSKGHLYGSSKPATR